MQGTYVESDREMIDAIRKADDFNSNLPILLRFHGVITWREIADLFSLFQEEGIRTVIINQHSQ